MTTHELVQLLTRSATAVDPRAARRRFTLTLLAAALLPLLAALLVLGPRSDWRSAVQLPMFWLKLAFPGAMALAAFVLVRRLGYPGARLGAAPAGLAAPVAVMWLLAVAALAAAPPSRRLGLLLGSSWWICPLLIAALALPAMALAFRAVAALAPTRLRLAGAAAGLFAGSVGGFAYALSCTEMQAPFLAAWYLLGMLIPAAAGAGLGRRLLRW